MLSKFLVRRLVRLRPGGGQQRRAYQTAQQQTETEARSLAKHLAQRIKATGPMTVAEYMREVLTHPQSGYYMHRDMFGAKGDFVTSPEISQMFGEMLAVWMLNEWQKIGSPVPLQLVELGPGRGTLSKDILQVFGHFRALHGTSLHLIEVSPHLSDLQAKNLCTTYSNMSHDKIYREGTDKHGIPVRWYKRIEDIPKGFSLYLAHEFFDALPIHKFHKTFEGFREVLIDLNPNEKERIAFRYVLAKNKTPMMKVLIDKHEHREHVEVSYDAISICENICKRLTENGGMALFCDYGHSGEGQDTFRAFRQHQQVDPLENPGSSDLTAVVDFDLLKKTALRVGGVLPFGPISQRDFLLKVGLEYRFKSLLSKLSDKEQIRNLTDSYEMLTSNEKMGSRFKFFALIPETLKRILDRCPVVGF